MPSASCTGWFLLLGMDILNFTKTSIWHVTPFTSTVLEIRIWSHRTIKVYVVMLPLIIITVSEIHQALTGSNCMSVVF
jgi:hypothetical protein